LLTRNFPQASTSHHATTPGKGRGAVRAHLLQLERGVGGALGGDQRRAELAHLENGQFGQAHFEALVVNSRIFVMLQHNIMLTNVFGFHMKNYLVCFSKSCFIDLHTRILYQFTWLNNRYAHFWLRYPFLYYGS